jgi:hypothetical protein
MLSRELPIPISDTLSHMPIGTEPTFVFTEQQAAEKSEIARRFLSTRGRLNEIVHAADNQLVKRFYNVDHNTYFGRRDSGKVQRVDGTVGFGGAALRRLH